MKYDAGNPTPALPLSGEGVKKSPAKEKGVRAVAHSAPPPGKGEVGRGLKPAPLHNLKSQKNKRRQLRKNSTEPEKCFWSWVRGKQLGVKFRRQQGIGPYIVDFYCAEYALIIELDGDTHIDKKDILYDKQRTNSLKSFGLQVIRFWNYDVLSGAGVVEKMIEEKIREIKNKD